MMTPKAVSRKVTPGSVFLEVAYCLEMVFKKCKSIPTGTLYKCNRLNYQHKCQILSKSVII